MDKEKFSSQKNSYLAQIRGTRLEFKRVALSPLRYAGGKSLAVGQIIKHLPPVKRVVSPFFGGGSVEIALAQKLGVEIIAADVNPYLVNYWHYQLTQPQKLYRALAALAPTKDEYQRIKLICRAHKAGQKKLSRFEQAVYYFYNHNLSYGPSFVGWASSVYMDQARYDRMLTRVKNFTAPIKITLASFERLFEEYPEDFFYCDPPYFLKTQDASSKMFTGIYPDRNNPVFHNNFNHEQLRTALKRHRAGFILSYNKCAKSMDYYKEYKQYYPKWQYTMGQGETRISEKLKNRAATHVKESHEVLIVKPQPDKFP